LFDCLEFSEALASIDILYDVAFLLMDLVHRGLGAFANRVLNRYLDRTLEDDGLAAVPLFLSLRAGIRAHVTATALEQRLDPAAAALSEEAHRYLDLADRALDPAPARLVAVGGLSGSGKSSLAAALAPGFAPCPGARLVRSDVTRKLLCGVAPETRLPESAYRPEIGRRVYDALRRKAAAALAAGYSAIVDAVSLRPAERTALADVARQAGVPFFGLWLEAAPAAMAERIRSRYHDASDATATVLARQLEQDPGPIDWARIDAGGGPETTLAAARRALSLDGP
jgi:predicted kinase